jgi:lipopolysaccharide/colanic/teichoic acid biosynthesis glycosyltransferase
MDTSKRVFDFILALVGLTITFPIFLIISLLIKLDSKGPVFFKQIRVGKGGKPFFIYKFRTMVKDADKLGKSLTTKDDPRITRVGKFLRKYKLDELPQLINVLKGEMSFVGPRPEVPEYVKKFGREFDYILRVKPGITDFASIEFRDENELLEERENAEDFYLKEILPKKLNLNRKYVENRSFIVDIILILKTIWVVLNPKGS